MNEIRLGSENFVYLEDEICENKLKYKDKN